MDVLPDEDASTECTSQAGISTMPGAHPVLGGDAGYLRPRAPTIDLENFLADIAADAPCGPDLQYDPDYVELAHVMQGKPDVEYGDMHIDAAEPDWKAAKALALKLLARTHDLTLAVWLSRILLSLHGFAGLDDGLALVEACIERHWDHVHPVLESDNDPTERLNILMGLDDMDGVLGAARRAPLVRSPMFGQVCLRDIDIATGELPPRPNDERKSLKDIGTIFSTADAAQLEAALGAIEQALVRLDRIAALLDDRVDSQYACELEKLPRTLQHAARAVREHLSSHSGSATRIDTMDLEHVPSDADGTNGSQDTTGAGSGDIRNRDDVAYQIDRICEYYAAEEPGSPVPVLLQRAKRLINMNFIEIMSELSPQGFAEISFLAGIRPDGPRSDADASEAYINP